MKTKAKTVIIGGGSAGCFAAAMLAKNAEDVLILERNDRVGKKLLATGNGQGNLTNTHFSEKNYRGDQELISSVFQAAPPARVLGFLEECGIFTAADERGRVYPLSRQASSVLDAFREYYLSRGVEEITDCTVEKLEKTGDGWEIFTSRGSFFAKNVIVAAGGKSGAGFGTDGSFYRVLEEKGHTLTKTFPSLVAFRADTRFLKNLKGVRVEAELSVEGVSERGDVLFTDSGVSGDAAFRLSAKVTEEYPKKAAIRFLPDFSEEKLRLLLEKKREVSRTAFGVLSGVVHKQIAKNTLRMLGIAETLPAKETDAATLAKTLAAFPVTLTGTAGFAASQVTKGGVSGGEVFPKTLESRLLPGVYLVGEILDVDGDCGGYNLQWAFSSATVAVDAVTGGVK